MTQREIDTLVSLRGQCFYNAANKSKFRSLCQKLLRELAQQLAIKAEIRFNSGGIAVSGESVFHADDIYVVVSADAPGILYRTCRGRQDFTGAANHWFSWNDLLDGGIKALATEIQKLRARRRFNMRVPAKLEISHIPLGVPEDYEQIKQNRCQRSNGTLRAWFATAVEAVAFAENPTNTAYQGDVAVRCLKSGCDGWHLSQPHWPDALAAAKAQIN